MYLIAITLMKLSSRIDKVNNEIVPEKVVFRRNETRAKFAFVLYSS